MIFNFLLLIFLSLIIYIIVSANNAPVVFGASVGSGFIKFSRATKIVFLGIVLGAILEGEKLTETIFGGILPETTLEATLIMTITTIIVLLIATFFRLPVPISNSLIGAAIGIGVMNKVNMNWNLIIIIIVLWMIVPFFTFLLSMIISIIIKNVALLIKNLLILSCLYSKISLLLSFYLAYVLGANTFGLLNGIYEPFMPNVWLNFAILGFSSFIGIYFLSRGVTASVGERIINLSPLMVFVVQFSGAFAIHLFTQFKLPVSLVQALIGSTLGIGFAKRITLLNKKTVLNVLAGSIFAPLLGTAISCLVIFVSYIL